MTSTIFANPGQTVRVAIQTTDGYGNRIDGYVPEVNSVYLPDLSRASGYPQDMTKLTKGLYYHSLSISSANSALGTFIVSIYYRDTEDQPHWELFTIQVARPFGNSSVSPA